MEGITRLVSESLARHGFDRPLDYRRLHWSRWFRCESHHSLLSVPSKPGVFALAEEVMNLGSTPHLGADAIVRPARGAVRSEIPAPEGVVDGSTAQSRMLAVTQFFEADDMAFVLDRMLSRENPMRARLASGRYFVRYVSIDEESQRRSICTALNQWIANSGEKVSGIGAHFAAGSSVAQAPAPATADAYVGRTLVSANANSAAKPTHSNPVESKAPEPNPRDQDSQPMAAPNLDSGAASNMHCPHPLPSGF
jgi:hypothetical protein